MNKTHSNTISSFLKATLPIKTSKHRVLRDPGSEPSQPQVDCKYYGAIMAVWNSASLARDGTDVASKAPGRIREIGSGSGRSQFSGEILEDLEEFTSEMKVNTIVFRGFFLWNMNDVEEPVISPIWISMGAYRVYHALRIQLLTIHILREVPWNGRPQTSSKSLAKTGGFQP